MFRPRTFFLVLLFSGCTLLLSGQDDCNQLGVWVWRIEQTGFSHETLARNLAAMDVKRVYMKVADGAIDSLAWPELVDTELVESYHAEGVEIWGWSYNYDSNKERQAAALYRAAQTGYDGFVVDVEMEFDGLVEPLRLLFEAFDQARHQVLDDGIAQDSFPLYCTTWGNPRDHNFSISSIDPYVDAFMPQTYVELWGQNFIDNISYWIEEGNVEYRFLGATKPIHHIASTTTPDMTSDLIEEFLMASGPETSLWRVPGGGVSLDIWQTWQDVDWSTDFCKLVSSNEEIGSESPQFYPNPTLDHVRLSRSDGSYNLYDLYGNKLKAIAEGVQSISLTELDAGIYILRSETDGSGIRIIKL